MKYKMCQAEFGVVWQKCQQTGVSYSILLSFTGLELDSPLASNELGKRSKKFCTMNAFGCQESILRIRNTWNMKNDPTGQGPRICLACPLHINPPRCWWALLAILKLHFVQVLGDSTWIQPRGPSSVLLPLVYNHCYFSCNLLSRTKCGGIVVMYSLLGQPWLHRLSVSFWALSTYILDTSLQ